LGHDIYIESFNHGPGGWLGWESNAAGARGLEIHDSMAVSRSPWWIDYNHAPPGAGYLQILFSLHTRENTRFPAQYRELGGDNSFISHHYPTDFRNANVSLRLKGQLEMRGASMVMLVQAKVGSIYACHALVGQPLKVLPEWSEQTLRLESDPAQWKCLGARHDRTDFYGWADVADVLRDVNCNILFVLFPLDVVPIEPILSNPHLLKAGEDYPVDRSKLPEGNVMLDEVRIEFASLSS
jgi:hypothetical protein